MSEQLRVNSSLEKGTLPCSSALLRLIHSGAQTSVVSVLASVFCSLLVFSARQLDTSLLSVPFLSLTLFPILLLLLLSLTLRACVCVCLCVFVTTSLHPAHFLKEWALCLRVCAFPVQRAGFLWLLQFAHTLGPASGRVKVNPMGNKIRSCYYTYLRANTERKALQHALT